MVILQTVITVLYYLMVAFSVVLMIWNFIRTKDREKEVLYLIVLLPFLLRLFRLK
jgi:hypothetical protein